MKTSRLNRRSLLTGAAAVAGMSMIGAGMGSRASAKAPLATSQAPAFYRMKIGALQATVVSDGPLGPVGSAHEAFAGGDKAAVDAALADQFLSAENLIFQQNTLLVNSGDRLVLIDTGMGAAKTFGPNSGRLIETLQAAGIEPAAIDAVVLTHAHPDHCWGLIDANGASVFQNAQIYMPQADFDFWTDESKLGQEMLKPMIEGTRKSLLPHQDRLVFIKDQEEFLPGIQAMATPGHTVGHTSYVVSSEGQSLLFSGDVAHHHVLSLRMPGLSFVFDTDAAQGVATRRRVFDMLSADRMPFLSYHFPWPGVGHVAKEGDGYRYVPAPMQMGL